MKQGQAPPKQKQAALRGFVPCYGRFYLRVVGVIVVLVVEELSGHHHTMVDSRPNKKNTRKKRGERGKYTWEDKRNERTEGYEDIKMRNQF